MKEDVLQQFWNISNFVSVTGGLGAGTTPLERTCVLIQLPGPCNEEWPLDFRSLPKHTVAVIDCEDRE